MRAQRFDRRPTAHSDTVYTTYNVTQFEQMPTNRVVMFRDTDSYTGIEWEYGLRIK